MKLIASLFATSIASTFILTSVALAVFVAQEDPAPPTETQSEGTTPPAVTGNDDALENLPAPMQAQVKQMLAKLLTVKDPASLRQALDAMDAQSAQMPEEAKPMFEYLKQKIQARIDELDAAGSTTEETPATTNETPATAEETPATTNETPATTEETPATTNETPAAVQTAMDDFLYGVLAGRKELAQTNAKFLLESGVTNQQLAQMIDGAGVQERLARAVRASKGMGEVGDLATQIDVRVSAGRLELARDSARIDEAVRQLGGTMRQQAMAKATLVSAGAYAVPSLLKALFDQRNPQLQLRASQTLSEIGRSAVLPLCEVIVSSSPEEQVAICNILTAINSKTAGPWLTKTLRLATSSDVKKAASTALRSLKVSNVSELNLWTSMARDYFVSRDALTPYPSDPNQVVWSVDVAGTIVPTLVATQIYGDVMAQRCAQEAMRIDPSAEEGLSIYIAAGLRSQATQASNSADVSMMSIALAAGPVQAERVLRLARSVNDPGLTKIAISILAKTASESMLVESKEGSPILGCLMNPSRSIRTAAALAIGYAMPKKSFQGANRVVPILASAVKQGGSLRAVVIASDETQRRELEGRLSQIECALLASEANASTVLSTLSGRGEPDLIIASGGASEMKLIVSQLRSNPVLASTPILMAIPEADEVRVDQATRQDPTIILWFQGRSEIEFQAAAKQLITRTIGATNGAEVGDTGQASLQTETLQVLRKIGEMQMSPFQIADAEQDLIDALAATTTETQILVARVLAVTPTAGAQRALLNAALSATEAQQIALLQAVAESGRLYGNQSEEKQIDRLRQALSEAKGANADALAQAYGALRVGTSQVLKLILK